MSFEKYRVERDVYEIDFALRLSDGETLSSSEVIVQHAVISEFVDATSELLEGCSVVGTTVQFTLKEAASEDEQLTGYYKITAKASTSQSRVLAGEEDLYVKE